MRWITNSLPFDFLKDHILLEVEVIYSHEILPDQTVYSGYRLEENGERIVIEHQLSGEEGRIKHCIAKTIWEKA
jgi:hypothetical protein